MPQVTHVAARHRRRRTRNKREGAPHHAARHIVIYHIMPYHTWYFLPEEVGTMRSLMASCDWRGQKTPTREEKGGDCIRLGGRGRGGVEGLLPGSQYTQGEKIMPSSSL